jgi:hypothetical protein
LIKIRGHYAPNIRFGFLRIQAAVNTFRLASISSFFCMFLGCFVVIKIYPKKYFYTLSGKTGHFGQNTFKGSPLVALTLPDT